MNIKIVKFFAIAGAFLVAIIITEWIISELAENRLLKSDFSQNRKAPLLTEIPGINLKEKTEDSYTDLVTRPLFIKGRRPVDETSNDQEDLKPGSDTFDWQLNGIYTTDQGLSALFTRTKASKDATDKFRKVKENGYLDDWKLTEIHHDRVVLIQDDESKELVLSKPKPKELPKTPVQAKKTADKRNDKKKKKPPKLPFLRKDKNQKSDSENKSQSPADSSENSDNEE